MSLQDTQMFFRKKLDFSNHWYFSTELEVTPRVAKTLYKEFKEGVYLHPNPLGNIRQEVVVAADNGEVIASHWNEEIGRMGDADKKRWLPVLEALDKYSRLPLAASKGHLKTRAMIVRDPGKFRVLIALGDPDDLKMRVEREVRRLERDGAMRDRLSPEQFEEYLALKYPGRN